MMKLKNAGSIRIRLGKELYLKPNEVLEVPNVEGNLILRKHANVINVTPKKPRVRAKPKVFVQPKPKIEYKKLDLNKIEVKKNDIE